MILFVKSIREKITGKSLDKFAYEIPRIAFSKISWIDGYETYWIDNNRFCEFDNIKSLSLVCTVDEQFRFLNNIARSEDSLIILGIIYFNEKNFRNARGINAFLPPNGSTNLFYSGTLTYRNREPWNLSHFLETEHFSTCSKAIRFLEERATINNYFLKKTPTNKELVEIIDLYKFTKIVNEKLNKYVWKNYLFNLISCKNTISLEKIHDNHYCYAVIYVVNNELTMKLPKGKALVDVNGWPDGDQLIRLLDGEISTIPFNKLSEVMESVGNNISDEKVWIGTWEENEDDYTPAW